MPAPPQAQAPAMPPPPTPAPAEVIGQAEVVADDRDRERNNQGDRVGEIRGREKERGEKIPVPAAEDPGVGSSNRGGPDRDAAGVRD